MTIFHSLWTKPMDTSNRIPSNLLDIHMYLMGLSATYAKINGLTIRMHTDTAGIKFVDMMPYDSIMTTLDEIPEWMPSNLWACGKIYAQKHEELGAVHIDYDVFLKGSKCIDRISSEDYDLVVQSKDSLFKSERAALLLMEIINANGHPLSKIGRNYLESLNCGVVGFRNEELKSKYINDYINRVHDFATNPVYNNIRNKIITPDLVYEQKLLYNISENYIIKRVLESEFFSKDIYTEAIKMEYVHLMGSVAKRNKIHDVIMSLKSKDIELYNKITNRINLLKKEHNYRQ